MRQVREVLRLTTAGVGLNEIARRVGVATSTVRLTLKRLASAGFIWPLPVEMIDSALETTLFAAVGTKQGHRRRAEPDWAEIHRELKRKHVTLAILWDEYIERYPDGYRYSRFCELYRGWASRLSVTMRQAHIGGDKLFVNYAGDTVPVIVDRITGQVRPAQIFVAVMGAFNFTPAFAGAGSMPRRAGPRHWLTGSAPTPEPSRRSAACPTCWCRITPRWPSSRLVSMSRRYRTYAEMATHYDTAILPARPRRPRDKTMASYCTSFGSLRSDGDEAGWAGRFSAAALEDDLVR